jgi:hypothetical protein
MQLNWVFWVVNSKGIRSWFRLHGYSKLCLKLDQKWKFACLKYTLAEQKSKKVNVKWPLSNGKCLTWKQIKTENFTTNYEYLLFPVHVIFVHIVCLESIIEIIFISKLNTDKYVKIVCSVTEKNQKEDKK